MVRLLRILIRLTFRAAAIAALVWIGRELMRRWVDGPEQPQVAGDWEAGRPQAAAVTTSAGAGGGPAVTTSAGPVKKAGAKKAPAKKAAAPAKPAAPLKPAARVKPATPAEAPGAVEIGSGPDPVGEAPAATEAAPRPAAPAPAPDDPPTSTPAVGPAKRRQRPLKATRIPKAAPAAKAAPPTKAAPPEKAAPEAKAVPEAKPDSPAGPGKSAAVENPLGGEPKGRRKALAAWVSPNGTGDAPSTHPVKAKLISRLYRVPGMPMYDRTVPDRCYTTPEAAEADGFTRAAR